MLLFPFETVISNLCPLKNLISMNALLSRVSKSVSGTINLHFSAVRCRKPITKQQINISAGNTNLFSRRTRMTTFGANLKFL